MQGNGSRPGRLRAGDSSPIARIRGWSGPISVITKPAPQTHCVAILQAYHRKRWPHNLHHMLSQWSLSRCTGVIPLFPSSSCSITKKQRTRFKNTARIKLSMRELHRPAKEPSLPLRSTLHVDYAVPEMGGNMKVHAAWIPQGKPQSPMCISHRVVQRRFRGQWNSTTPAKIAVRCFTSTDDGPSAVFFICERLLGEESNSLPLEIGVA